MGVAVVGRTSGRIACVLAVVLTLAGCVADAPNGRPAAGGSATAAVRPTTAPTPSRGQVEPRRDEATLLFTGDMLVSDPMRARALAYAGGTGYDFGPMLREVAPIIRSADWAICHQETPISADNRRLSGYPNFYAPSQLAAAEKAAGYDACSTASNHTLDQGVAGVRSTLDTFDRVGIRHAGSARNGTEARRPAIYRVAGIPIGHLSYAYGLNGVEPPNPWVVNLVDPAQIRADARRIRLAGARFVVVSLHFGTEYQRLPTTYQREVVTQVMRSSDVDLVVGHHAHVVQPIQRLRDGRWVIWGLGNFLAEQSTGASDPIPHPNRDGVIVTVRIGRAPGSGRYVVNRVGYIPTFVYTPADVVRLAPPFSKRRTVAVLTSAGAPIVDDTRRVN
jgi:poly-gamma-glutamate capsule biosynthesis protein CapA/YwtB (metallophosphatase superfamily)